MLYELNKTIKSNLLADDIYIGEYISHVDYKTPVYSALPFKNVRNMQNISKADRCYSFSDYSENSEGATFWITANIKHLPVTLDDENSLKEIVNIKSLYGSVISIEEVAGALEMGLNDKRIAEAIEGDVFIKLRVNNVMMNSDVLEVTFKNKPLDLSWCDEFINTTEENDCSGTYSLKELLKGLESGTKHYPFQEKPFFILLSKSKM